MFKSKRNYLSEIVFLVAIILFVVSVFVSLNKKVLADDVQNGQVNLTAWSLKDKKKSDDTEATNAEDVVEATLVYESSVEQSLTDLVIPNAADFKTDYPNLKKLWIEKATMSSVANNADRTSNGTLKISDTDDKGIYAKGEDWQRAFRYKYNIKSIDLSRLDTSSVTDMSSMFDYCGMTTLDLSGWDISSVTNMSYMFSNCGKLTTLDLSGWDTSSVTNMSSMFSNCGKLTTLNLSGWNTSSVTDMSSMFSNCGKLTTLNLSGLDTSSVTDMNRMFHYCGSLTTLDLSGWNTSSVTDMSYMFYSCGSLTTLDLSGWDTSSVTSMSYMFQSCYSLTDLNFGDKFDLSGLEDATEMFKECRIYDSNAFANVKNMVGNNTINIGYIYGMYANCIGNGDLYLGNLSYNYDNARLNDMKDSIGLMFNDSHNLLYLDLSSLNLDRFVGKGLEKDKYQSGMFTADNEPLLITNDTEYFKNYDYKGDHRVLFTTTLKVDGKNAKFRGDDEGEDFVQYSDDKTTKYINVYTAYTTPDSKEEILKKLSDRLEEEKKNLIIDNGYGNAEWQIVGDNAETVAQALDGIYVITFDGVSTDKVSTETNKSESASNDGQGHSWNTIKNSSGNASNALSNSINVDSKGKNLSVSQNQNSSSHSQNLETNSKTSQKTESKIPEKLRTRKYLVGYPDGKIKPENNVTRAEFVMIIYRLMDDGEKINLNNLEKIDDVKESDWFGNAVAYLIDDSRKIIDVTDKKFRPNENIKQHEISEIIHNILKFYNANENFVDGPYSTSNSDVIRAKMAKIIFMAFDRKDNPGKSVYSDLSENHWAYKFLMDASE